MELFYKPLSEIVVGENFSRETLGDIQSLKASMELHGLQQPIIVQGHNLVAGFRRYHAAKELGWETIAAVETDQEPRLINLIENLQRESLSFYEEARAVHQLYPSCTDQQVADALGRTTGWSRPRNQLFKLPQEIIDSVREGHLTPNHINTILNSRDRPAMIARMLDKTQPKPKDRFKPGKKYLQQMLTIAVERELHDVAQTFRFVIGDINEEEFWDEVGK